VALARIASVRRARGVLISYNLPPFLIYFSWWARKVTKEPSPALRKAPWPDDFRGVGKTRCHRGMPGVVMPIPFIATVRFIGIYPLKQFAPVIHGNRQARGRIAMGSPAAKDCCLSLHVPLACGTDQCRVRNPTYEKIK